MEKCKTCEYSTWNESANAYECKYANYAETEECSSTYEEKKQ